MTTPPVQLERRAGQRFPYLIPVAIVDPSSSAEGHGFTQDLSSRGVFFFTDMRLEQGSEVELTLMMPSEITLGQSMRVRCRGRVLRVVKPAQNSAEASKIAVAVRLEGYEYLPDPAGNAETVRVGVLHPQREDESQPTTFHPR